MAKRSAEADTIQGKIKAAQDAVAGITDATLRVAAFKVVLQHLLISQRTTSIVGGDQTPQPADTHPGIKQTKQKVRRPAGPKGRVELLVEEGFFKRKRTIGEVKDELANRGWFHTVNDLNPTLLRLVKDRKLRRIKEPGTEGGKLIWRYSDW